MHVIAQRRIRVDGIDDALREVARMRSGEAHAANAGHFGHTRRAAWRNPSPRARIAIAVHVLAQQLNLGVAGVGQLARFRHARCALVRLRSGPRVNGTTQ